MGPACAVRVNLVGEIAVLVMSTNEEIVVSPKNAYVVLSTRTRRCSESS